MSISSEISFRKMAKNLTDKSTLFKVMVWCCQEKAITSAKADQNYDKLERLERLRSEDNPPTPTPPTPPPHDYPFYWVKLDPKSREDKVKVTNLKNSPKFQFFLCWNIYKH